MEHGKINVQAEELITIDLITALFLTFLRMNVQFLKVKHKKEREQTSQITFKC
jgi:hypothetical protein